MKIDMTKSYALTLALVSITSLLPLKTFAVSEEFMREEGIALSETMARADESPEAARTRRKNEILKEISTIEDEIRRVNRNIQTYESAERIGRGDRYSVPSETDDGRMSAHSHSADSIRESVNLGYDRLRNLNQRKADLYLQLIRINR